MSTAPTSARHFNALIAAGVFCAVAVPAVLWGLGGWAYYAAPLATRGYLPAHQLLRPSGAIGLPLGIAGAIALTCTLPYAVRKRSRALARFGSLPRWLEVHIFFGIVGPVLVTLHTSFKFNGVIAVGYWLMAAVWTSGFVGRYLYVQIPKTIRGVELSREEMETDVTAIRARLTAMSLPPSMRRALDGFLTSATPQDGRPPGLHDLFFGEFRVRVRLLLMRNRLRASGADLDVVHTAIAVATDHAMLARRIAHLHRTRQLFGLWHLFHRPLVYVMFILVALHVGVAFYLGYAQLEGWGSP